MFVALVLVCSLSETPGSEEDVRSEKKVVEEAVNEESVQPETKVEELEEMPVLAMDPARQAMREFALRNTRNMAKKVRARALKRCPRRGKGCMQ